MQEQKITMEHVKGLARQYIIEHGSHAPQIIAIGSKNAAILIIESLPDTTNDKMQIFHESAKKLREGTDIGELHDVYFISETWFITREKYNEVDKRPSECDDRQEALVIYRHNCATDKQEMVMLMIERNDKGVITDAVERDMEDITQTESPLMTAFMMGYHHSDQKTTGAMLPN